ncbi:hypothetical protein TNCV_2730391 [Trichonephila clavipes]|nr:hypothetical protein TNCV_2730391 [Trichonephila clavipes]
MPTSGSSFTPTPLGHENNLEVRHYPPMGECLTMEPSNVYLPYPRAVEAVATVSMQTAVKEAKDVSGHSDIPVAIDGTWQKHETRL